ncbi:DUF3139 domain-containing protein [Virgibacillus halodenitrificans]|uniref:DUF3139 domain-containing protein n=1 Tax=Virgibacillus halodenitrificans TaxID=1482 RepID=A0ABR7VNN3_VIRHA|nr:DUF3139 domain-containing protein [Virgibacillus halodenitrificans]MBD1222019.1 DUF3139 domain-containing protein [Virgibacillus halodenitrificans]MYL56267.1 DUF3139 domain-containing protein [Virgibacillus halodenitrificans]
MSKKAIWIIISLILLTILTSPFGIIYLLNNGNPYTKYIANKNVPQYLHEMGYLETDIEDSHYVEPKNGINNEFYRGHYMVIFKDESDVTYYYGITKKGKNVKQFCEKHKISSDGVTESIEGKTKYSEEKCAEMF